MSMFDDHLDTTIDDVARAITAGRPDASFAPRVVALVDAQRPRALTTVWRAACVGALAIVVAALAIRSSQRREKPLMVRMTNTIATTVRGPDGVSSPLDRPQPVPPSVAPRVDGRRVTVASSIGDAPAAIAIAPVTVDPLTLAAVAPPDSIQPNALDAVAPIAVAPLGEDPERRFR